MRGGAVAARRAHNPKVAGSSPAPATNKTARNSWSLYLRSARCAQVLPSTKKGTFGCLFSLKVCGIRSRTNDLQVVGSRAVLAILSKYPLQAKFLLNLNDFD